MSTTLPPTTPTPTSTTTTTTTTTTTVAPQPIPPQPITPIIPIPSCCDIDGAKVCGSVYFKNESLSGGDIFASKQSIPRVDVAGKNTTGGLVAGKMKIQSTAINGGTALWVNIEDFQLYDVTMTDLSGDSCIPITGYLPEPNPVGGSPTIPNFVKNTIPPLNSNTNTPPIPINPLNSGIVTSTTITTPSNNNSNTTATMTTTIKVGSTIPNANRCGTGEDTCNNLGF